MDHYSILEMVTLLVIFVSSLLTIFTFSIKTRNGLANKFLAFYFLIFSIHISVFIYSKYITFPPVLEMLRDQIAFFTGPLLYFYVLASIYSDFKLKSKHLWHIIPFLIVILIFTPEFYLASATDRISFIEHFSDNVESKMYIIVGLIVPLFYLVISFWELKKYKIILADNYSNKKSFNYKWLFQLLVLLSIIYAFSFTKQVYKLVGSEPEILNLLRIVLTLVLLFFLTWIVLKSMFSPELFRNVDSDHYLFKKNNTTSDNRPQINKKNVDKILSFISKEEPYLDSSLTMNKLAQSIEMSPRELSFIINTHFEKHFFDFINEYRINKAKSLLKGKSKSELTIKEVMYEVGFNSKSSFYTEFKKLTSVTPTQYRESSFP